MKQTPFPYQSDVIPLLRRSLQSGHYRPCIVAPCGAGKTTMIALIAEQVVSKGGTVIVRSFRRRLIQQLSERLRLNGVEYGVLMADLPDEEWAVYRPSAPVQVASSHTLTARKESEGMPRAEFLIDDEIQAMTGKHYRDVRDAINPRFNVLFTATPCYGDGRGFGPDIADDLIEICRIEDLLTPSERCPLPRLVRTETYEPVGEGKRRRKGLQTGVAGDPVRQWIQHAVGMRTLVFANTIKECNAVRLMYQADSIPAAHINADSPIDERDEVFARLESGDLKVIVCTPSLMGVGVDLPFLECVQSLVMHAAPQSHWQAIGRAQRIAEGKTKAVWLNHSASNHVHGSPNVSPAWKLGERDSVQRRSLDRMTGDPQQFRPKVCQACGLMMFGSGACPKCGTSLRSKRSDDGNATVREPLERTVHDDADAQETYSVEQQMLRTEWRKMMFSAANSGMTCKALASRFKSRFGRYPNEFGLSPSPSYEDRDKKVGEWNPSLLRRRASA